MKYAAAALTIALACAPALAQDDPPKKQDPTPPAPAPAPADGAKKPDAKPEAPKERKVDDLAMKALERHIALVCLPASAGLKDIVGKGGVEQGGMSIGINPKWSQDKGFDVDVDVPDKLKQMLESQGRSTDQIVGMVKQQMGFAGINTSFDAPGRNWSHYDVSFKQKGDDQVVTLAPFDDKADAESREYVFGKDGLLKTSSMSPKVDPDNPQMAMLAGQTFDSEWKFEKKGDRYLLTSRTLSIMGTDIDTKFTYYDGPGGSFLLKDATTSTPMGEQVIKFRDYTVDGKFVDSTKAEAPKPAVETVKKETKEDKPAEKPADNPPAPVPPAPKEDGK